MNDVKTLANINFYAIIGTIEKLVSYDDEARKLATVPKPLTLGVDVNGGPIGALTFGTDGGVVLHKTKQKSKIKMNFSTPERFNQMVDGTKALPPINPSIILNAKFLSDKFTALTKILEKYLRPSKEDLQNEAFFVKSTELTFYVMVEALACVGNCDKLGMLSAKRIPEGTIALEVNGGPACSIDVKDGKLTVRKEKAVKPRASMIFANLNVARKLLDGAEAIPFVATEELVLKGFYPMLENLNRILYRVPFYLS